MVTKIIWKFLATLVIEVAEEAAVLAVVQTTKPR